MVNIIPMLLMPISNGIAWYLIVQKSKSPLCLLSPLRSNVWKISFFYAVWALYNRYFVAGREGELGHYSFGLVTLMCLMTGSSFYNNMKWTKTSNNVVYAIKIPLLVSCGIVVLNFSVVIPMIISSNGPKNFAKKVWKIDDDDDDDDDDNYDQHDDEDKEKQILDNPWGLEPEDDDVLEQKIQTGEKENYHRQQQEQQQQTKRDEHDQEQETKSEQQQQQQQQKVISPGDVNVDDIIASLQKQQALVDAEQEQDGRPTTTITAIEDNNVPTEGPTKDDDDNDGSSFDPTYAFQREGVASQQISPRDFRVAAASNEYETVQRYLTLVPEHLNRQDKYGWTALHFATRSGHARMVQLLLSSSYDCDVTIESKDGQTAFDVANEKFGMDHPVTQVFLESGLYDDYFHENNENENDYENENENDTEEEEEEEAINQELLEAEQQAAEEARMIAAEHQRREEQARIAKRQEETRMMAEQKRRLEEEQAARLTKEKKIAEIAEQERFIQEEKRRKLFPSENEDDDDVDEDDGDNDNDDDSIVGKDILERKRSRLDALLRDEL